MPLSAVEEEEGELAPRRLVHVFFPSRHSKLPGKAGWWSLGDLRRGAPWQQRMALFGVSCFALGSGKAKVALYVWDCWGFMDGVDVEVESSLAL